MEGKNMLVVSAHAADYVWRSGAAIAKYIQNGANVHLVILSVGVRGESNDLWNIPGQTAEKVQEIRKTESLKAANALGVKNIEFWDLEDYPICLTREHEERMIKKIRQTKPNIILTHDKSDILNPDHNTVHDFVFRCSVQSISNGVLTEGLEPAKQMAIYGFEPHQTELSDFVPSVFIDVTQGYDQKIEAMNCFQAQKHLIEIYTQRLSVRGNHARRLSGNNAIAYAECYANRYPVISGEFVCR